MPEGDTVWLTAKRLDQALAGHVVTTFDLRVPALATADLTGETLTSVSARGKHLLMRFANGLTLHSHLRMDGSWRIGAANRRPAGCPNHQLRALIGNQTWLTAGCRVHDLALVHTSDEVQLVGHLGPDLLDAEYDDRTRTDAVANLAAQPDTEIGLALLDQRVVAGIGNMYKSEILFLSRINPWRPVRDLGAGQLDEIVGHGRRLLFANRNHPEQSTTGRLVRGAEHWVYLRAGQSCRVCGTAIRVADQGPAAQRRVTFWCPACQPG